MPTELTVPGVAFVGAPIQPRILTGLRGFHYFVGTLGDCVINHAPGGSDLGIVGVPQMKSGGLGVTLKGMTNFFETGLPDTEAFTHALVWRSDDTFVDAATQPHLIGNFAQGANQNGASLFINVGGVLNFRATSLGTMTYTIPNATSWRAMVARCQPGVGVSLFDLTAGTRKDVATTNARILTAFALRIGSGHATFGGTADYLAAATWNLPLTDAEILGSLAADLRALSAEAGVSV